MGIEALRECIRWLERVGPGKQPIEGSQSFA